MKRLSEMLLCRDAFSEIVLGNTAIVRAMVEEDVRVAASYPGSPTPEIADAIASIPKESRPFYFEFSINEKVATELAFGAAINGFTSVVFFKSVGLNVAADSFVQLPLMDIKGGMVMVLGDDPGANSSQNEQDNRHYALLSNSPMLEASTPQDAYLMMKEAIKIARAYRSFVILRMTTHVCHAKQRVDFAAWDAKPLDATPSFDAKSSNFVPIAEGVFPLKAAAFVRLKKIEADFESSVFNTINYGTKGTRLGIIAAGETRLSVQDALGRARSLSHATPDVLELGTINPLPRSTITDFIASHAEVKIIEELDTVLENQIKSFAYDAGLRTKIVGKVDPDELQGEYRPEKVVAILDKTWPGLCTELGAANPGEALEVVDRPPQLCPGCGHRTAFHAIKRAIRKDDITVADIGCHTLGFLEPYEMGQVLLSMGHSVSTASGLSLFNSTRRVLCFLGDSTLFHAGMPGIVNAVYNNHKVLLILMENGTTAMTGHQDIPTTGKNFNAASPKLTVRSVLEGLGVANIREIDAYKEAELSAMVKEALEEPGFKVIIAKHPCMLKFTRQARKRAEWKPRQVKVEQESCALSNECISQFACPSFQRVEGKIVVSKDLCIGDGSCIQTCGSGALVWDDDKTNKDIAQANTTGNNLESNRSSNTTSNATRNTDNNTISNPNSDAANNADSNVTSNDSSNAGSNTNSYTYGNTTSSTESSTPAHDVHKDKGDSRS